MTASIDVRCLANPSVACFIFGTLLESECEMIIPLLADKLIK
jgi:hypothetical protein